MSSSPENGTFFSGDIFVASASSVLMLVVVVELCSDTEFPLGESERVDSCQGLFDLGGNVSRTDFLVFYTGKVCF